MGAKYMNIFNYLSNLLFTKKQPEIKNVDQEGDYQPYLVNRWCSMLSKSTATIINSTANTMFQVLENKSDHYKFLHYIIPQHRFTRINYIKKVKIENTHADTIKLLAKRLELSAREINLYISQHNIDLTKYERHTKT